MGGNHRNRTAVPNRVWAFAILAVAVVSAGGCSSVLAFPGGTTQLLGLGAAAGFLVAALAALFYLTESWPLSRVHALLPLAVTLLLAWLSFGSGRPVAKWWFNHVRLPHYEAAAAWVKSQDVPVDEPVDPEWTPPFIKLPPTYSALARITEAHRHADGSLVVVFVYSGAFPVKHFAYMYSSTGTWDHHLDHRWHGARLSSKWFSVSD